MTSEKAPSLSSDRRNTRDAGGPESAESLESLCSFWSGRFDPIKILSRIPR